MKSYLYNVTRRLVAGILAFPTAFFIAAVLATAFGLAREDSPDTIWIIDERMIAVISSMYAAVGAAQIASTACSIKRIALLSPVIGCLVAVVLTVVSKCGASEGIPMTVAALITMFAVGLVAKRRFGDQPVAAK